MRDFAVPPAARDRVRFARCASRSKRAAVRPHHIRSRGVPGGGRGLVVRLSRWASCPAAPRAEETPVAATRREPLLVFYDGACPVCTRSIAWALKLDRYSRLRPVPAGRPQGRETAGPPHARHRLEERHVWSGRRGVRRGSDAIAAMLVELPGLGWAGHLLGFALVRPFARLAYRVAAKNRHRLPAREAP